MFQHIPEFFRAETADTEAEADRWYTDKKNSRRPPELLPRDEVTRAIFHEVKAGRGSTHGGVYLDIATRRPAEEIKKRLPSMYHQFKNLAGLDITREPMEVYPTCHYSMGGVRVDAATAASTVAGLFAAGEVAGGLHGANRLGGNSLSDLLVFGRRAGQHAAAYVQGVGGAPRVDATQVEAAAQALVAPLERSGDENPFALQSALQDCMQEHVGIFRDEAGLRRALTEIEGFRRRLERVRVTGGLAYNPGFHLSRDLYSMLTVADAVAKAAIERKETRGGHSRTDYPAADPAQGKVNVIAQKVDGEIRIRTEAVPPTPADLRAVLEG